MTKSGFVSAFLIFIFCNLAAAQDRGLGLGIIVGEPTGISLKKWSGTSTAVDGALAWSFEGENFFQVHGDYLSHNFTLIKVEKGKLPFYYGLGGRIKFVDGDNERGTRRDKDGDKTRIGVRIPLGLAYLFEKTTLDLFLEVVPILDLIPKTDFKLNAAVGVRYFFK